MTDPVLSRRALGRATLARQMLLERDTGRARTAVARLAGMQAQAPLSPYVGLWTRLVDFDAEELADLMRRRAVVRATLMRVTIHLVTAPDALAWRPVLQRVAEGGWRGSQWSKQIGSASGPRIVAAAHEVLDGSAMGRTALGHVLAQRFPDADAFALGGTVLYLMPTVQPSPRGVWGEGGPATITSMTSWLGRDLDPDPSVDDLVLRYLAAFGPASVKDMQNWSRLTKLSEVVERMSKRLRRFRSEDGVELFDLVRAPRPPEDTPAPVRFLPEFDNLLLGHADRTRVNPGRRPVPLFPGNGAQMGTFLIDGEHAGLWRLHRSQTGAKGGSKRGEPAPTGKAVLRIEPFATLPRDARADLAAEGLRLLAFIAAGADSVDVEFTRPS